MVYIKKCCLFIWFLFFVLVLGFIGFRFFLINMFFKVFMVIVMLYNDCKVSENINIRSVIVLGVKWIVEINVFFFLL